MLVVSRLVFTSYKNSAHLCHSPHRDAGCVEKVKSFASMLDGDVS